MKTFRARFFWRLAEIMEGLSIRLELLSEWLRDHMGDEHPATPEAKMEQDELFDPQELKAKVEAHHRNVARRLNHNPGDEQP